MELCDEVCTFLMGIVACSILNRFHSCVAINKLYLYNII
jgi:hypothetical protein